MSDRSKIQWTDATWNVTAGCTKVSPGCDNCYAAMMAKRLRAMGMSGYQSVVDGDGEWTGTIDLLDRLGNLPIPLHWKKPRRIFVNSMSDLFHPTVWFDYLDRVFEVMSKARQHVFQILTKRPERMAQYLIGSGRAVDRGLCRAGNLWLGTTCENQAAADERIPHLLKCPASVKFLSLEPLLGPINILPYIGGQAHRCKCGWHETETDILPYGHDWRCPVCATTCETFNACRWVIVGPETGPRRRPCDPAWIRGIVEQCAAAGVPCFVKAFPVSCQTYPILRVMSGDRISKNPAEWPEWARVQQFPEVSHG